MSKPRDLTLLMQNVRNFLLRHNTYKSPNRFPDSQSPRDVPPAKLPQGSFHKLSNNDYHVRDARRGMPPPTVIFNADQKLLPEGNEEAATKSKSPLDMGPGFGVPDLGEFTEHEKLPRERVW